MQTGLYKNGSFRSCAALKSYYETTIVCTMFQPAAQDTNYVFEWFDIGGAYNYDETTRLVTAIYTQHKPWPFVIVTLKSREPLAETTRELS